jgi:hypothetical protein
MQNDRLTNDSAQKPLKLQFSLRSLLIATAIVAADLAIVAQAGPTAVLGLMASLTSLALGVGGMLIVEAVDRARPTNRSQRPHLWQLIVASCSVWLFMMGALGVIALNVLAVFPSILENPPKIVPRV